MFPLLYFNIIRLKYSFNSAKYTFRDRSVYFSFLKWLSKWSAESLVFRPLALIWGPAKDNAVQIGVGFIVWEHHYSFFDVYCPDSEYDHPVLFITVRINIILVESFDGLALDIVKGFYGFFFLADDGMNAFEPGCSDKFNGIFHIKCCVLDLSL